jgi:hypothetical protein
MKKIIAILLISYSSLSADWNKFLTALRIYESGDEDYIEHRVGDNGRANGPYQIHESYFIDSGVKGDYYKIVNSKTADNVVYNYLKRYAKSWDVVTLARIHNGGPKGHLRESTFEYGQRILNIYNTL